MSEKKKKTIRVQALLISAESGSFLVLQPELMRVNKVSQHCARIVSERRIVVFENMVSSAVASTGGCFLVWTRPRVRSK